MRRSGRRFDSAGRGRRGMRGGSGRGFGFARSNSRTDGPFSPGSSLDRGPLYRSRYGMFLGVCRGLAEYFDFSVIMVRVLFVIAFIMTGFWPVGVVYLVAAAIMKPEPVVPFNNDDEREFYDSYADSRVSALSRLKRKFDSLDRRIRRMEDVVTSRDFEWEQKLKD